MPLRQGAKSGDKKQKYLYIALVSYLEETAVRSENEALNFQRITFEFK